MEESMGNSTHVTYALSLGFILCRAENESDVLREVREFIADLPQPTP